MLDQAPAVPQELTTAPEVAESNQKAYFIERMAALGIDPENVPTFKSWYTGKSGQTALVNGPFFSPDPNGNVRIHYPGLNNNYTQYNQGGQLHDFTRWRKHPKNIKPGEGKYGQPSASGVNVFITPTILELIEKGEKAQTLYMVEGEFKAMAMSLLGLPALGINGIFGYKEPRAADPHPVILDIIKNLKPNNLVLLLDADATEAPLTEWSKNKEKDLGKRFFDFYTSASSFRSIFQHYAAGAYLVHLKADMLTFGVKGIDDLLAWKRANSTTPEAPADSKPKTGRKRKPVYDTDPIKEELQRLPTAEATYFEIFDLSRSMAALRKHFFLTKDANGCPKAFYEAHQEILQLHEFVFNRGRFVFDDDGDILTMTQHEDADRYIRLGTDYIKEIFEPNPKGKPERKLVPWKKSEIEQDYVKHKGLKDFFKWIPKFDGPCNVPDNTDTYQLIHTVEGSKCYNLYHRLSHTPSEGNATPITDYLAHIFGDQIDMALDYMQLLYLHPTQQLPIIALVSRAQHTGKTTFLKLLNLIFEENATIVGNDELTDRFNADFATKLVIGVDEGLIEKRGTVEKIKAWSTSDRVNIDAKHSQRHRVSFFGKIVICSNNEDNFLPIDQEDSRFWVVKVNRYEGPEKTDLEAEFIAAIPAFLQQLRSRQMVHPKTSRHWFAYQLFESEAKNKLKENSKDWLQTEVEAWLKTQFLDKYLAPEIYFSGEEVLEGVNANKAAQFRRKPLTRLLTEIYQLEPKNSTYQQPKKVEEIDRDRLIENPFAPHTKKGRCYTFTAAQFLSPAELADLKKARKTYSLPELASPEPQPGED